LTLSFVTVVGLFCHYSRPLLAIYIRSLVTLLHSSDMGDAYYTRHMTCMYPPPHMTHDMHVSSSSDMGDAYYTRPSSMGTAAKARPSSVGASSRLGRDRAGKGGKVGGQEERWQDTAIELIRSLMDNMVTSRPLT
jgi:hypothetical protein